MTHNKSVELRQSAELIKRLALRAFRHEVFTSSQVEEKDQHELSPIFLPLRYHDDRHRLQLL